MRKTIYQVFADHWPEDEAAALRDYIDSEYTPGTPEHTAQLETEGEEMAARVFDREPDAAELRRRFFVRLYR
jgi:hypothetical protein